MSRGAESDAQAERPAAAAWALAGAGAAFAVLVAAATWPATASFDGVLIGWADAYYYPWNLWWFERALAGGESLWRSPLVLHPFGADLAQHDLGLWPTAVSALFHRAGLGLVGAVNALVVLTLWLNAMSTYLLARAVTRRALPAFFAGTLFAFAPFFTSRLLGHFSLLQAYPLVLLVLCLYRGRGGRRAGWNLGAGLCAAVACYSHFYFAIYAVAAIVGAQLLELFRGEAAVERRQTVATRARAALVGIGAASFALAVWIAATGGGRLALFGRTLSLQSSANSLLLASFALLGAASTTWRVRLRLAHRHATPLTRERITAWLQLAAPLALVVPLALRWLSLAAQDDLPAHDWSFKGGPKGAFPLTALLPNLYHPLWGERLREAFAGWDYFEYGSIGLTWTALFVVACGGAWRDSGRWRLAFLALLTLSFGPFLRLAPGLDHALLLPHWLLRNLPVVSGARIPSRWIVMALIPWAVLAALGFSRLRSRALQWTCVAALLFESLSAPIAVSSAAMPSVYNRIAADRSPGSLLELPFGVRDGRLHWGHAFDAERLYYQTRHRRPLVGGYLSRVPDRVFAAYREMPALAALVALQAEPATAAAVDRGLVSRLARELDVRWIVLDGESASPRLAAELRRELGDPAARSANRLAWRLPPPGRAPLRRQLRERGAQQLPEPRD